MARSTSTKVPLHCLIETADMAVLEEVARHERTTVSQLARKIVADWIRALPKQNPNKDTAS